MRWEEKGKIGAVGLEEEVVVVIGEGGLRALIFGGRGVRGSLLEMVEFFFFFFFERL